MNYLFQPHYLHIGDIKNHGLDITFHKQVPDTQLYTIAGSIKNSGEYNWREISVQAIIRENGHVVNNCGGTVNNGGILKKGEEGFFRIQCYQMPTNSGNYTYKIKISYGSAYEKST